MQNLKYLKSVVNDDEKFGMILNDIVLKHSKTIQLRIALSLLEFFNSGKAIDEKDILFNNNVFYVSK